MIIVPTLPAKSIAFDAASSGGGGGDPYPVVSITRSWTHTLNSPGSLVVFAGVLNEGRTTETPTTATCNGVAMTVLASTYAQVADQRSWVKAWFAPNLPAGAASINIVQNNGSSAYQYLDMAAASYANATTAVATVHRDAGTTISAGAADGFYVMCGVYGGGSTVSPNSRFSEGYRHIGDQPGSASTVFTCATDPLAAITVKLS